MKKELFTRKTKPPSNVDTVVNMIKDLLIKGQLNPGDMLPSEKELSESLAISRGSIREAMKILSSFGVIEIRQGDGTYIPSSVNAKLFDPLLFNVLASKPDLEELIELRVMIEGGIVDLVIKHASDKEIAKLEAAFKTMETQITGGVKDLNVLLAADLEYHRIMAQITKNSLIEKVYGFVMDLTVPTMKPGHGLDSHRMIIEALYKRDISAAVEAVKDHDATWKALNWNERVSNTEV